MNTALTSNVISFVQVASNLSKRAMEEIGRHRTAQKNASARVPAMVTRMLDTKTIEPIQKQAAVDALSTHAGTLDLLKHAVDKIAELRQAAVKRAGDLGQPDGPAIREKSVYNSLTSPFVGQRTSLKKASDIALLEGLGLPTE